jgi:NADPH:quinone reductase-like Zn-dependent oxidoreductase
VGVFKPQRVTILGQELAGDVEAVGSAVKRFKPGDAVFAIAGLHLSAYAEYVCLSENGGMGRKPANMTYEQAACSVLGGLEAVHFLTGNVHEGDQVLIVGAGGSIGTFGVQLARYYGAEVTAVDSAEKLDMLRSIGADHVIDYTREDFTQKEQRYDVIFDVVGKGSFSKRVRALQPNGRYLLANPGLSMLRKPRLPRGSGQQVLYETAGYNPANMLQLKEVIEATGIQTVIDRTYPLEQIADAHRYVDTGMKKGNVAITVEAVSGQRSVVS